MVYALSRAVLYRSHVSAADSGPQAPLSLHRQSDLQPRALLHHHPRLPHLRRGPRDQLFFLSRHRTHPPQRPFAVNKGPAWHSLTKDLTLADTLTVGPHWQIKKGNCTVAESPRIVFFQGQ